MESFKAKITQVVNESERSSTTVTSRIFSVFQTVGAIFTIGFVIQVIWNTVSTFLLMEPLTLSEAVRDFAACLGFILSYEAIHQAKKG